MSFHFQVQGAHRDMENQLKNQSYSQKYKAHFRGNSSENMKRRGNPGCFQLGSSSGLEGCPG